MAREVEDKKTRQALARLRRAKAAVERAIAKSEDPQAAEAAKIELTDWEDEFMASLEDRLNTFGSAFADPSKGEDGEALSRLQIAKLKEIEKKAKGKSAKGFNRAGSSFKNKNAGFKRKGSGYTPNVRDIHEDITEPDESQSPPDAMENLKRSGLIHKGMEADGIKARPNARTPPLSGDSQPARPGLRVIKGGKS